MLTSSQRTFKAPVDIDISRHPGSAKAKLIWSRGDVGERPQVADQKGVAAALPLLGPQLASVPKAHCERYPAGEAVLESRRERREAIGNAAGALHPPPEGIHQPSA
jgi:hypothetical protein